MTCRSSLFTAKLSQSGSSWEQDALPKKDSWRGTRAHVAAHSATLGFAGGRFRRGDGKFPTRWDYRKSTSPTTHRLIHMETGRYGGEIEGGLNRAWSGTRALLRSVPFVTTEIRMLWAGRIAAGGLALGMLLSTNLWLTRPAEAPLSESFPQVPPVPGLEALSLPPPLDTALFTGTLGLCALAAVIPRRWLFAALFGSCLLLVLPDVMRWQPWVFLYLALMGVLAFVPRKVTLGAAPKSATEGFLERIQEWVGPLQILRLLVGCVYCYSGANKLNAAFLAGQLEGFLGGIPPAVGDSPVAAALTYSAPLIELAAGLGLILGGTRLRHAAMVAAALTNLFVIAALISNGANSVVWPWNLAMVALLAILFAGRDKEDANTPSAALGISPLRVAGYVYASAVIILFAFMPAFGVLGYWPSYLSFALYSENTPEASVTIGGERTSVTEIAYEQLNVPAYPAPPVFKAAGERQCNTGRGAGTVLVVHERPDILGGQREQQEYTCTAGGAIVVSPEGDMENSPPTGGELLQ